MSDKTGFVFISWIVDFSQVFKLQNKRPAVSRKYHYCFEKYEGIFVLGMVFDPTYEESEEYICQGVFFCSDQFFKN